MSDVPEPTESGYAAVNGVQVWYQIYGEGEPLILLHGGLSWLEAFGPNIARLAQHRQVIGVDLQGHGGTGALGRPMTFEAMATDIAELIKALGHEKADVMGYSLGATALRLAIDHPDVVDRLVIVSAAFAFSNWHDYNFDGMRGIGADPDTAAESLVGTPVHETYVRKAQAGADTWVEAVREIGGLLSQDYDWSAEIPEVKAPTLLIYADWDSIRIAKAVEFFELLGGGADEGGWRRENVGASRLAVIPNQTHYEIVGSPLVSDFAIPFLEGYADETTISSVSE
ncbi:hypothetical protein VW35_00405 [Devosia soli]|uniref:AB hydrolase-1 domain-containing protein n=1 Tax=Devosia soli TaxID=361041 RepID=A0A0F5LJN0_9HYPH|nr:alpha/beta hydrolase [Devosia soli]KKB82601.1 hypothetical protein VW35_00405 [Devosia soli]